MKTEKFRVIQFIREFIIASDKILENFPKSELELKNRIRNNSYDLLEITYEANSINNIEYKKELLFHIIAKIKVMDFLINLSYDKKLITQKKYYVLGRKLDDIAKFVNGWLKKLGATVSEDKDLAK